MGFEDLVELIRLKYEMILIFLNFLKSLLEYVLILGYI